ncbi:hypothetical protein [Streptomyces sp. 769]|uniref:protein kinase domain-containing protein n=1 Tax=Streptomyces sp. 769 TaxID=1262452 RepID=UPI00058237A7|nr:hypothetical protein [Streptomyces sp. 769]AJC54730.1 serine/threonine protein kinase with PASTA sensor(s) [Streptomyces sp. 769]
MSSYVRDRYEVVPGPSDAQGFLLARDRQLDRLVNLEFQRLDDAHMRRRLSERIREVLAMPPHPGLVLLRDAFHDDARYCLISDWVDGERWGTRPLPVAVALDQLAQIADVLEFLRARRPSMAHGALSPERLVVRPDGRVCVHGLATSLVRARRGPAPAAVVPFLAPEVLAGEEPTPASDLYSLAALAMHLLTGLSPASAAEHGLSASPREAALITHVLRTGLAHDPVLRPPSPLDFVRRLRARLTATLPTGTVTFLLTDVCDSTRLWDTNPQTMVTAVERYEQLCTEVVDRFGGFHPRDQGEGDSHFAAHGAWRRRVRRGHLPARTAGPHRRGGTAAAGLVRGRQVPAVRVADVVRAQALRAPAPADRAGGRAVRGPTVRPAAGVPVRVPAPRPGAAGGDLPRSRAVVRGRGPARHRRAAASAVQRADRVEQSDEESGQPLHRGRRRRRAATGGRARRPVSADGTVSWSL